MTCAASTGPGRKRRWISENGGRMLLRFWMWRAKFSGAQAKKGRTKDLRVRLNIGP
jgi:hypothetical protein